MDKFKTLFQKDFRCKACNNVLKFTSKRRKCSICSNLYAEFIFCRYCSISLPGKRILFSVSIKFCMTCYQTQHQALFYSFISQEDLPSSKDFSKLIKKNLKIIKKNPFKFYKLIENIGNGSSGYVYKVEEKSTGDMVAIKQIELKKQFNKEKIMNEIGILMLSPNKNIIKYHKAYEYHKSIWIHMELMSNSIQSLIKSIKLNENAISYITLEVLKGIEWLHLNNRIHRDIKSDNILYNASGDIIKM